MDGQRRGNMNIYIVSPSSFEIIGVAPVHSHIGAYVKVVFVAPDVQYIIDHVSRENEKDRRRPNSLQKWGFYNNKTMKIELFGTAASGVKPGVVAGDVMPVEELKRIFSPDPLFERSRF
jgi:hypothetical protein